MAMKRANCLWAAFLVIISLITWLGCQSESNTKVIKIGHATGLTGDTAVNGQSQGTGLKIAVEELNKKGGILGKQIQVVDVDTRNDPAETVNAIRRLVEQEKVVAVLGVPASGSAMAATPVVTAAKIPLIATAASNPYVTADKQGGSYKYVFRVCFIDTYQGLVDAQFAYDRLKARRAAVLYDVGSDYSQWLSKYFEEAFIKQGGSIVAREAYRTGELDFRAPLGKIKTVNPDLLFLPVTNQKDAALAVKQARDVGIKAQLLGGDSWASPDVAMLAGPAIEGAFFSNMTSVDDPQVQGWVSQHQKDFSGPITRNALLAYDAVMWLADAIKRANSTDGDKIVAALEQTKDLPVLTTDKFTIDPKTHDPLNRPAYFSTIRDAKFVFVERYAAK
jgi:branched-chain amino acid transport system substrate-binding protein